jgi:hypothetical protein
MSTSTNRHIPTPRPLPIYFAECRYGRLGNAFRETDRDSNSRDEIISLMRSGEIEAIKILEVNEINGTVVDVTLELQLEASAMEAA